MARHFRFAAHSEIGLVRKNNQDSGYATPDLLVVADGMGGAAAGDLASAAAIDRIRASYDERLTATEFDTSVQPAVSTAEDDGSTEPVTEDDAPEAEPSSEDDKASERNPERTLDDLATGILAANDRLGDLIADDHQLDGMGTTVSAVQLAADQYAIAHIGDSRAYLWRDGELHQLTHDHSWVQSLVDEGRLTVDEANYHPHRSLLLKVLNGQPQHDPDLTLHDAQLGDRILLCSDGLCGFVPDDVIAKRLVEPDREKALAALVLDAHAAGGSDNITVIVADLVEVDDDNEADLAVVLGAAVDREIPDVGLRPRADHNLTAKPAVLGTAPSAAPSSDSPATEAERYAPRVAPPWHRRWGRTLLVVLLAIVVLGGAGAGTYAYARAQYFVAPHDDQVAIYRGLNEQVGSWRLNELYEAFDIEVADLPRNFRDQLERGITTESLDGARGTVDELRHAAEICREVREDRTSPTPPPTPQTPQPPPSGTASPAASPTASPTATTAPSPQPSPSTAPSPTGAPTPVDEGEC